MAAALMMIVPAPGRFAVGILLAIELNLLMLTGTYFRSAVSRLRLGYISDALVILFLVCATMFYRQLLVIIIPEAALQLGFILYLPAVSSYCLEGIFSVKSAQLSERLPACLHDSLRYSLGMLLFFLFRDIAGYGTISYPTTLGIDELVLFDASRVSAFSFFATIPGTLIVLAGAVIAVLFVLNKRDIVRRAEQEALHD
ncbi:MAG: hypothetical protein IJ191_03210 [Treponema sp.]|nr:hypothetical protein [Treponema sp.]